MFKQPVKIIGGSGLTESLYFEVLGECRYTKNRAFSDTWLNGDDSPELTKEVPERYYEIIASKLRTRNANNKDNPEDFIATWTDNMITNIEHFLITEPVRVRGFQLEDFVLIVENSVGKRYKVYLDNYGSDYTVKVSDGTNIRAENLHHAIVTRGLPKEVGFGRELPRLTHLFY